MAKHGAIFVTGLIDAAISFLSYAYGYHALYTSPSHCNQTRS